ncbi:hypothetical protein STEG23_016213, partial [Scotinomys teguina]
MREKIFAIASERENGALNESDRNAEERKKICDWRWLWKKEVSMTRRRLQIEKIGDLVRNSSSLLPSHPGPLPYCLSLEKDRLLR